MTTDTTIATSNQNVVFFTPERQASLQAVDNLVSALIASPLKGFQLTEAKINVVQEIEKLLDPAFMAKVMSFQNKPYGFKTDCDLKKNPSAAYPEAIVKNCVVQAILFGAEITGNEMNILGGNAYFTKEYCENYLIRNKIWNKLTFKFSKKTEDGNWFVPVKVEFIDPRDNKKYSEDLEIPVARFEFTKEDTMRGAAKRDALAYIIAHLRSTPIPLGDQEVNIVVDSTSHEIIDGGKVENKVETKTEIKTENKFESNNSNISAEDAIIPATAEQQAAFNKFISNREKYTDFDGLKKRAKTWCDTNKFTSEQLDLTEFNKIKDELILPKK